MQIGSYDQLRGQRHGVLMCRSASVLAKTNEARRAGRAEQWRVHGPTPPGVNRLPVSLLLLLLLLWLF